MQKHFLLGPRERLRYRDQWYCWACHNCNQDRIQATYSCNQVAALKEYQERHPSLMEVRPGGLADEASVHY